MSRGCAAAAVAGWVSSTGPARTVLDDPGPWPAEILAFGDLIVVLDDDAERAQERKAGLDALDGTSSAQGVGSPAQLAEQLLAWAERGLAGFRLRPAAVPHELPAITRGVIPLLQARGAFRTAYEADTLRGRLHDLDVAGRPEGLAVLAALAAVTSTSGSSPPSRRPTTSPTSWRASWPHSTTSPAGGPDGTS